VVEAEIHFDFPSPSWISGWTKKEYSPGEGMAFGLGMKHFLQTEETFPNLVDTSKQGTHTIDQALYLFGPPASVTGFFRSNRGVESDVDDTFTIILQYSGERKNLVVTVKTAIVSHMKDQLKFLVRGTNGSYLKVGTPAVLSVKLWQEANNRSAFLVSSGPALKKPKQSLPREKLRLIRTLVLKMNAFGAL
jgi:Oxidoreductase family, C-terminal alpha/beta domain